MEPILTTFGIDWHLLVINAVNFGLLLAGLTYFLYGPVTRMLEERRKVVAEGVEAARQAQAVRDEVAASRNDKLAAAGKEADTIVSAARTAASAREREIVAMGEANAAQIIEQGKREADELKAKALQESKAEVAKLIVLGVEKAMTK
jgi:F-type H+-transporting ATPase subunit b